MAHLTIDGFRGARDKDFFLKLNDACRKFLKRCLRRLEVDTNVFAIDFGGRTYLHSKGRQARILGRIHFEELAYLKETDREAIAQEFRALMQRYAPRAVVSSVISCEE